MEVPGWFFNRLAEIDAVSYPQDAAGGEVPTPSAAAVQVPCCLQQDAGAAPTEGQKRRGAVAGLKLYFRPSDAASAAAVAALKVNDRVQVSGMPLPLVLDGPAFDASGRGVVWEAAARDIR